MESLKGLKALVTAGPTHEPIDPVRYIANRSSGKQGYAIAEALAQAGAEVTLISGPTHLTPPKNVKAISVQTAQQMHNASLDALPIDIAICAAAVADWAPVYNDQKIKKQNGPFDIKWRENPDILNVIATHKNRPKLVIGFAAETENLLDNARKKRESKGCDWIVANDVSQNVFGSNQNHVYLITQNNEEEWPLASKDEIAVRLVKEIMEFFKCP